MATATQAGSGRAAEDIGRIIRTPGVWGGKWRIAGTRIPPRIPWEWWADGASLDDILREYPTLEREDALATIAFEQGRAAERDEPTAEHHCDCPECGY